MYFVVVLDHIVLCGVPILFHGSSDSDLQQVVLHGCIYLF